MSDMKTLEERLTNLEAAVSAHRELNQLQGHLNGTLGQMVKGLFEPKIELVLDDSVKDLYPEGLKAAKAGDAGIDIRSPCDIFFAAGNVIAVKTGVRISIGNPSIACQMLPRSGLGSKGLILGNSVGLIDSGYQGDLTCYMWNRCGTSIVLKRGDRFAQMCFVLVAQPTLVQVEEFTTVSERGTSGFGSSGVG